MMGTILFAQASDAFVFFVQINNIKQVSEDILYQIQNHLFVDIDAITSINSLVSFQNFLPQCLLLTLIPLAMHIFFQLLQIMYLMTLVELLHQGSTFELIF